MPDGTDAATNSLTLDIQTNGGARRDRTDDLMLAKHALSQLSYSPEWDVLWSRDHRLTMVGLGRLERPTSPLSGVRSNHLSYRPSTIERFAPRSRYLVRKRNEGGICPAKGL